MKIVFMGTPEFAVPSLEAIIKAGYEVPAVVTQPDRRGNRGKVIPSPVKAKARINTIGLEKKTNKNIKKN